MPPEHHNRADHPADIEVILAQLEKLPDKTDVHTILNELERLRCDVTTLRSHLGPHVPTTPTPTPTPAQPPPTEQLVTLDQIGAMVHRSKRTMERYRRQMPAPRVRGRRGQPHLWAWGEVRPWLEATFGLRLPDYFPGHTH
jgi:hypothetical protein